MTVFGAIFGADRPWEDETRTSNTWCTQRIDFNGIIQCFTPPDSALANGRQALGPPPTPKIKLEWTWNATCACENSEFDWRNNDDPDVKDDCDETGTRTWSMNYAENRGPCYNPAGTGLDHSEDYAPGNRCDLDVSGSGGDTYEMKDFFFAEGEYFGEIGGSDLGESLAAAECDLDLSVHHDTTYPTPGLWGPLTEGQADCLNNLVCCPSNSLLAQAVMSQWWEDNQTDVLTDSPYCDWHDVY